MPTIDEIISSAVTQLTTKRSNIRTALQSKYNETIPSSMTFGDVPTYITNVANYQYSLGLADGASSGGGSYMHENNSQLLNSYVATGGQTQHNGTYTKLDNTYHRGFNVYKNNNYDMYLVCVDDDGNRWQVCVEPSETSYQYKEGSSTSFGPVGSYPRNTSLSLSGTVVISAPGSSSSSVSSSTTPTPTSSSSGDESSEPNAASNAPAVVYVVGTTATSGGVAGTYNKREETQYGNATYYCSGTGKYIYVIWNDTHEQYAWVIGSSIQSTVGSLISMSYSYYTASQSSLSSLSDSPAGIQWYGGTPPTEYQSSAFSVTTTAPSASSSSAGGDSSDGEGANAYSNAPTAVNVWGNYAENNGYDGTYTKESDSNMLNGNATYYCSSRGKYFYVAKMLDTGKYGWICSNNKVASFDSQVMGMQMGGTVYSTLEDSLLDLQDTPETVNSEMSYNRHGEIISFYVRDADMH